MGPCWHYVGSSFVLGGFFSPLELLLGTSWLLLARLGHFFDVLERSRLDFGGSWEGLERVWEAQNIKLEIFLF